MDILSWNEWRQAWDEANEYEKFGLLANHYPSDYPLEEWVPMFLDLRAGAYAPNTRWCSSAYSEEVIKKQESHSLHNRMIKKVQCVVKYAARVCADHIIPQMGPMWFWAEGEGGKVECRVNTTWHQHDTILRTMTEYVVGHRDEATEVFFSALFKHLPTLAQNNMLEEYTFPWRENRNALISAAFERRNYHALQNVWPSGEEMMLIEGEISKKRETAGHPFVGMDVNGRPFLARLGEEEILFAIWREKRRAMEQLSVT